MKRVYFLMLSSLLILFSGCNFPLSSGELGRESRDETSSWSISGSLSLSGIPSVSSGDLLSGEALSGIIAQTGSAYQKSVTPAEKVAQSKRRNSLNEIIRRGDFFALRNDAETALAYYQESIKKLPDDITLKKKIANIYYSLKNWSIAYQLYIQVPFAELSEVEQYRLYTSLFFGNAVVNRLIELDRIPWSPETHEYYRLIDTCYTGIHNCVIALEKYNGSIKSITWLRDAMKGYEKVSDDFHYRNLLLIAELYKQGQYRAVSILSREVYEKRPDYYANLKLYGFSLYELGRYDEAKNVLEDYYRENPKDADVIYILWEIAFFLHDPLTSNMYLNNAVTQWYTRKTDIERRMAYNYYTLMDIEGMVKVLGYLIQEEDATEDDFAIAVYMAWNQGDSEKSLRWVDEGIMKFPQSDRLFSLKARALRTLGRLDEAETAAQQAYVLDGTNALAMLELWYIRTAYRAYPEARYLLERMLEVSNDSTFSDEASTLLSEITEQEIQAQSAPHSPQDGWNDSIQNFPSSPESLNPDVSWMNMVWPWGEIQESP